ncbi:MAG: hypothetical protein BGO76_07600 [Caedibacter sp. 38-128]|nr:hypothetical protein [Holosporales bacterium]OJX04867.1 MAG: hypothetical protein BGO76_07600 [Caedibacter sp. 38-128]
MKNAFIYFVIGIGTLSLCPIAFTEAAPQALEQEAEHKSALSNQEMGNNQVVEENLPEDTVKNTPKKKKQTKKPRKAKQKTDKKKSPKKTKKSKAKQKKKAPAIKEEETKTKDLPSSQDEAAELPSESPLNSTEDNE